MKFLVSLIILVPSLCLANLCPMLTGLAKTYHQQNNWEEVSLQAPGGSEPLTGFVDNNNNLHLQSFSRRHQYKTKMTIESRNPYRDMFIESCKNSQTDGSTLSALRETSANNRYVISVQYLPNITGFNNRPYDEINTGSMELSIDYSNQSIVSQTWSSQEAKRQIYNHIRPQIDNQRSFGSYTIDLTNLDDFACDLLNGDAQMSIYRRMFAESPLIKKNEVISTTDVELLYKKWQFDLQGYNHLPHIYYTAGVSAQDLASQGTIDSIDNKTAIKLLDSIFANGSTRFPQYGSTQIRCLADSVQDYTKERLSHLVNVEMTFDKQATLSQGGL